MLISDNNRKNVNFSIPEVIRCLVWCTILLMLLLLKYIYPNNSFVMTYFTGVYQFLEIITLFIFLLIVEDLISKKKHRGKNSSPGEY